MLMKKNLRIFFLNKTNIRRCGHCTTRRAVLVGWFSRTFGDLFKNPVSEKCTGKGINEIKAGTEYR